MFKGILNGLHIDCKDEGEEQITRPKNKKTDNFLSKRSVNIMAGKVIGIDLGTTNSCVAVMEGA